MAVIMEHCYEECDKCGEFKPVYYRAKKCRKTGRWQDFDLCVDCVKEYDQEQLALQAMLVRE